MTRMTTPIDLRALDHWNRANRKAREAYYPPLTIQVACLVCERPTRHPSHICSQHQGER